MLAGDLDRAPTSTDALDTARVVHTSPGTNPGTSTAYHPTALPTVRPYALPVPGFVPGVPTGVLDREPTSTDALDKARALHHGPDPDTPRHTQTHRHRHTHRQTQAQTDREPTSTDALDKARVLHAPSACSVHSPRGGPMLLGLQGYLSHKKLPPPRTLQ